MFRNRKKVISTQNYRKCVHQGQQEQVHEPKRGTRGDHHIREGQGGMAKEGKRKFT